MSNIDVKYTRCDISVAVHQNSKWIKEIEYNTTKNK